MECNSIGCPQEARFAFWKVESRKIVSERHLCDAHAEQYSADFRSGVTAWRAWSPVLPGCVCVDLEMVIYRCCSPEERPCCIYLHELNGTRRFATMVDRYAWASVIASLKGEPRPRPLAHGCWARTIQELGGRLRGIVVDSHDAVNGWYQAKLQIDSKGRIDTVDVRASDSYVLAVECSAPIYIVEAALERLADRGDRQGGLS